MKKFYSPFILVGSWLFLIWTAAFFFPRAGFAQGSAGLVRPEPLVFEVGQGQVERLALLLENAQDVYGLDVRARFDPAFVEVIDVNADQEGVQMIPGEFPKPDFVVKNQADNATGTLMYVLTQVNPSPPANGNGVIVWLEVRGKKMGESPFVIEFVDAANREGKTLQIEKRDGIVRVVNQKPPTSTPTLQVTSTQSMEFSEIQPTKAKKPKKTLEATSTVFEEETKRKAINPNRVLLMIAGGSLAGALGLFGYASYLARKPKQ